MRRKDLDYLVIVVMFLSGLYVAITGLVTDLLGLHQFAFHRYAGYIWAAMAVLHLILNWGRVTAYLRRRFGRPPGQELPARRERATPLSRRGFLLSALGAGGGFILGRLISDRRRVELPDEAAARYLKGDVGLFYHQWSKPGYSSVLGTALSTWGGQPERYKTYADAERTALPDPHGYQGLSLEEAIERRRSRRDYIPELLRGTQMTLTELSRLLHAAQGITDYHRGFRAAPSAGALYPIELYAVVHNVEGLGAGVYHYAVREHELELLQPGDFRAAVMQAGLWQDFLGGASVCFVLSALFQRTRWKYRERTYRYILLEAGHIGQNLYLAATSMGLGTCAVGAFLDDDLNDLLGLDGKEEATLYLISVGKV
jgi:SagB-type dehydrogenase family enzyme